MPVLNSQGVSHLHVYLSSFKLPDACLFLALQDVSSYHASLHFKPANGAYLGTLGGELLLSFVGLYVC